MVFYGAMVNADGVGGGGGKGDDGDGVDDR